jgi:hypothetical protein
VHCPSLQIWSAGHALPQDPQLFLFMLVLTQVRGPQLVRPFLQLGFCSMSGVVSMAVTCFGL